MSIDRRKDFVISYVAADKAWAEWVGKQLQAAGRSVILADWDFRPGFHSESVKKLNKAMQEAARTLVILSPRYLTGVFAQREWVQVLQQDLGDVRNPRLVRVRHCDPVGIFGNIKKPIELADETDPGKAYKKLLRGIDIHVPTGSSPSSFSPYPEVGLSFWNVPHERASIFIGRDQVLEELRALLETHQEVTVGSDYQINNGGTPTAVEYIYRHKSLYRIIIWVEAESRTKLVASVRAIADQLQLPQKDAVDAVVMEAVKNWLQAQTGWLLVLDNVQDTQDVREILPDKRSGQVLLTTQRLSKVAGAHQIELQELRVEDKALARYLSRIVGITLNGPKGRTPLGLAGVSIGRDPQNTIVLSDLAVSSYHAEIRIMGQEGYALSDGKSTNGTFVNKQRLRRRRLLNCGDRINIAKIAEFIYEVSCRICHVCGHENSPTASFCQMDGIPLETGTKPQSTLPMSKTREEPVPIASAGSLLCPKCGNVNRSTAKYCQNEGILLSGRPAPVPQSKPLNPRAEEWKQRGDQFGKQGRYNEALNAYKQALSLDKTFASAHDEMGKILFLRGRYQEALGAFEAAVRYRPEVAEYHSRKGDALYQLKEYERALNVYEQALTIDERLVMAYIGKGNTCNQLRQYVEASHAYDEALHLDKASVPAHCGKGKALAALRYYELALKEYDTVLLLDSTFAEAHCGRGDVYYTLGKGREALQAYTRALELKPELVDAHVGKGNVLYQMEVYNAALEEYEKALSLDRKNPRALRGQHFAKEKLNR